MCIDHRSSGWRYYILATDFLLDFSILFPIRDFTHALTGHTALTWRLALGTLLSFASRRGAD